MSDLFETEFEPTNPHWRDWTRNTMQIWGIANGTKTHVDRVERIQKWATAVVTIAFGLFLLSLFLLFITVFVTLLIAFWGM